MSANSGSLALLGPSVPMGVRTMVGSAVSVAFRAAITPFDTLKTNGIKGEVTLSSLKTFIKAYKGARVNIGFLYVRGGATAPGGGVSSVLWLSLIHI